MKQFPTLAHLVLPNGSTLYHAKVIASEQHPSEMTLAELAEAFGREGVSFFSWSMHPHAHESFKRAEQRFGQLKAPKNQRLEQRVEIVIDVREQSVRAFAPL